MAPHKKQSTQDSQTIKELKSWTILDYQRQQLNGDCCALSEWDHQLENSYLSVFNFNRLPQCKNKKPILGPMIINYGSQETSHVKFTSKPTATKKSLRFTKKDDPFDVFLLDSVNTYNENSKSIVSIENLNQLIRQIVIARLLHPLKMQGSEIKYMRVALNQKQKYLASRAKIRPEYLSRCEHDDESFSSTTETAFRLAVLVEVFKQGSYTPFENSITFMEYSDTILSNEIFSPDNDNTERLSFSFHKETISGHNSDDKRVFWRFMNTDA